MNTETDAYNCWTCDARKPTRGKTLTGLLAGRVSPEELSEYLVSLDDLGSRRSVVMDVDTRRPELPEGFRSLVRHPAGSQQWRYMLDRGVSIEDALFHRIGACDSGPFSGRIVFPSFDEVGELNFFTTRKVSRFSPGPTYVTCDTSKDIIFNDCLIDWRLPLVVVEGPFDMLAVGRNAVPLQGKMLRPSMQLFQKIVRKSPRVYVCLDSDAVGDQLAICHLLYRYCVDVRSVRIEGYKDLGEMPRGSVMPLLASARGYDTLSKVRELCG